MILTQSGPKKMATTKFDGLVKSHKIPFSVIPSKAGIQSFQAVVEHLDSGFHRSDDFLRIHQISMTEIQNPKQKTIAHAAQAPALRVEPVWSLRFGAWNFRFQKIREPLR
jgi:hypothetical protein